MKKIDVLIRDLRDVKNIIMVQNKKERKPGRRGAADERG